MQNIKIYSILVFKFDLIYKINSESFKVITRVMKKNNVDFDFQFRVRKYLEYCFNEENEREKEEHIFNKLSKTIKDEYDYQIYGKKILNIPFFRNNFSKNCLLELSKIIKKVDFCPEETFIQVKKNCIA